MGELANQESAAPTPREIQETWPATVSIPIAAAAFGLSRSHAYELVNRGEFPARVIQVGQRYRVVTASVLRALSES
ncbi:helix-turn-helix transcriptional regulator [Actinokineospora iranica]|uniref:helix-turn-helix transcriptional regulator n=1 Tax=Actinokineospora iranica TaxID=1271860 RepID=UPI000B88004E|nr:helix-turn-helix domain-containing protein [Actinokineospora iranica]